MRCWKVVEIEVKQFGKLWPRRVHVTLQCGGEIDLSEVNLDGSDERQIDHTKRARSKARIAAERV